MTTTTQNALTSEIFTVGEKVWWVLTYSGFASKVTVTDVEENVVTVLTTGGALMNFPKKQPENPQELITHSEPITPELKPCPTYWEAFTDF
jgi:hypothetical protein